MTAKDCQKVLFPKKNAIRALEFHSVSLYMVFLKAGCRSCRSYRSALVALSYDSMLGNYHFRQESDKTIWE